MNKYKDFAMFCLSLLFLVVFSCLLNNDSTYATSSITINLPPSTISLDVVGASMNGTFAKSSEASFSVSTTNSTGYTLNIKSDTSSGNDGSGVLLLNGNDTNYTIASIGGSGFPVGGINEATYKTSSSYINTWGYKPSMIDSSVNANFLPSPDTIGDTINVTNCANGTVDTTCTNASDTYSIAIGAKVDSTVRIGSYSNTFVILATANAIPYTIIYDDNTITNMPVDINTTSQTDTVNISSNVPAKDGYTFLGWCDTTPTTTNGVDSCPTGHTVYNPNGNGTNLTYTLNRQSATNNLHLYAMWSKSGGATANYVNVTVNFAGAGASGVTGVKFTGTYNGATNVTMTDIRTATASNTVVQLVSGVQYTIEGIYNGAGFQSWSVTAGSIGSTSIDVTTYTTTVASTITLTAFDKIYMWETTSANCGETLWDNRDGVERSYTTGIINDQCWMTTNLSLGVNHTVMLTSDTSNVSSAGFELPASYAGGFSSDSTAYVYNSESTACGNNSPCYGYYSWVAATANSGTGDYDICPKGWRLPTPTELTNISKNKTGDQMAASPFYGVFAGDYYNNSFSSGGSLGYYWSSSGGVNGASGLRFLSGGTSSGTRVSAMSKKYGHSVRCLAKE